MKLQSFVLCICIILMLVTAGCITTCIPIKPTAVIKSADGTCNIILENVSYEPDVPLIPGDTVCGKLKVNETNWVKFKATSSSVSPITGVCDSKEFTV